MRVVTSFAACAFLLAVHPLAAPAREKVRKEGGQAPPVVIPVWPGVAPGSESWTQTESELSSDWDGKKIVRNVVRPTLTAFLPDRPKANGTAMIVCPGGSFRFLAWEVEGTEVAEWLRARGVAAFVLKYRLLDTGSEEEFRKSMQALLKSILERQKNVNSGERPALSEEVLKISALAAADGRQAVRVVRGRAAEWGVQPDRVGIMGFSAGGMVTAGVVTGYDAAGRPSFAAPIYAPVVGSVKVPGDAPPLFLLFAGDDALVPPGDSIRLYSAWRAAGKSAELHVYARGGHGFGMRKQGLPCDDIGNTFYCSK
jgi:acetyl esterase/lipase